VFETTGLSMAYSVSYWVAAGLALFVLQRQVHGLVGWATADVVMRAVLIGAAVLVAIGLAEQRLVGSSGAVVEVAICVLVALPVFVVATYLVRPAGFEPMIDRFSSGLRRRTGRAG
jgi:peptidoglycan biosynthesis protein MviN/MurJ (putative lipid II flippase)